MTVSHTSVPVVLATILIEEPLFHPLCVLLQNGATALLMASQNGHLQLAEFLLRDGKCDPHIKDKVSACMLIFDLPFSPMPLDLLHVRVQYILPESIHHIIVIL